MVSHYCKDINLTNREFKKTVTEPLEYHGNQNINFVRISKVNIRFRISINEREIMIQISFSLSNLHNPKLDVYVFRDKIKITELKYYYILI